MDNSPIQINLIPIVIILVIIFVLVIAAAAALLLYRQSSKNSQVKVSVAVQPPLQNEIQLKVCPQCHRTYSDLALGFCLEDGAMLSNSINTHQHDSGDTMFSGNFK